MILSVEKNIETGLLKVFQIEFVGKLTKKGALFKIVGVWLEDL